jgi:hypothetical protein
MRQDAGRPSPGLRARVTREDGVEIAAPVTVLIVEKDPAATIDWLRHTVRRTHDPRQRYEDGLKMLASEYYEDPRSFSGVMTGLFSSTSATAHAILVDPRCVMSFQQADTRFDIPCAVELLDPQAPAFQVTYWHNRLFNPNPPAAITVLAFDPDWGRASVDRPPVQNTPERTIRNE